MSQARDQISAPIRSNTGAEPRIDANGDLIRRLRGAAGLLLPPLRGILPGATPEASDGSEPVYWPPTALLSPYRAAALSRWLVLAEGQAGQRPIATAAHLQVYRNTKTDLDDRL